MTALPVVYLSEQGGPDWLALPRRCPSCNGGLYLHHALDAVACLLCARPLAQVREVRPVRASFAGEPRYPIATKKPCAGGCGGSASRGSKLKMCRPCADARKAALERDWQRRYRARLARARPAPPRPRCEVCNEPTPAGRSRRFCAAHLKQHETRQRALREGRVVGAERRGLAS